MEEEDGGCAKGGEDDQRIDGHGRIATRDVADASQSDESGEQEEQRSTIEQQVMRQIEIHQEAGVRIALLTIALFGMMEGTKVIGCVGTNGRIAKADEYQKGNPCQPEEIVVQSFLAIEQHADCHQDDSNTIEDDIWKESTNEHVSSVSVFQMQLFQKDVSFAWIESQPKDHDGRPYQADEYIDKHNAVIAAGQHPTLEHHHRDEGQQGYRDALGVDHAEEVQMIAVEGAGRNHGLDDEHQCRHGNGRKIAAIGGESQTVEQIGEREGHHQRQGRKYLEPLDLSRGQNRGVERIGQRQDEAADERKAHERDGPVGIIAQPEPEDGGCFDDEGQGKEQEKEIAELSTTTHEFHRVFLVACCKRLGDLRIEGNDDLTSEVGYVTFHLDCDATSSTYRQGKEGIDEQGDALLAYDVGTKTKDIPTHEL